MLSELYTDKMMALAANIPHSTLLETPQASASSYSKICGSRITLTLNMDQGRVSAFGQEVKACLLGQCAASVLGGHIIGCDKAELLALKDQMQAMLKEDGTPPQGKWQDLALLLPVRAVPQRHTSVMLVFEAVAEALEQI